MNKFIHLVILYKNHFSIASWYEAKQAEDIQIVGYKGQWLSNLHYVNFAAKADIHKTITLKNNLASMPKLIFLKCAYTFKANCESYIFCLTPPELKISIFQLSFLYLPLKIYKFHTSVAYKVLRISKSQ